MQNKKNILIKKLKFKLIFLLKTFFRLAGYLGGLILVLCPRKISLNFLYLLTNKTPNRIFFLFYHFNQSAFNIIKFKFPESYKVSKKLISGSNIILDITQNTQRQIYFWKIYEPHITYHLKSILNSGDWAIDIGANIGYHTLLMSDYVGDKGRVFAFEPERLNYENLVNNIMHSDKTNIVAKNLALGEKTEKRRLFLNIDNEGGHSFVSVPNQNSNYFQEVKVISLDNYLEKFSPEEIKRLKIVKIDVEGFERQVLSGMKNLLISNKNIHVICEISQNHYDILDMMSDLGYKAYLPNSQGRISPTNLSELYGKKRDIIFKR